MRFTYMIAIIMLSCAKDTVVGPDVTFDGPRGLGPVVHQVPTAPTPSESNEPVCPPVDISLPGFYYSAASLTRITIRADSPAGYMRCWKGKITYETRVLDIDPARIGLSLSESQWSNAGHHRAWSFNDDGSARISISVHGSSVQAVRTRAHFNGTTTAWSQTHWFDPEDIKGG